MMSYANYRIKNNVFENSVTDYLFRKIEINFNISTLPRPKTIIFSFFMNFNNKYVKKYSEFKLELPDGARQVQNSFDKKWVRGELLPVLVQFLNLWHGAEVERLSFYLEENPLKIFGVVGFFQALQHKIDPHKPEIFRIKDIELKFFPSDFASFQKNPVDTWEQDNEEKTLFTRYLKVLPPPPPVKSEKRGFAATGAIEAGISIVNTLKDIALEINKVFSEKKKRNQSRSAIISKVGDDLSAIFNKTCNVFIHKRTDRHEGNPEFYGVLFEDIFIFESTSYKVYVFREGAFRIRDKCRREHHWFASGKDKKFARLSFWRKGLYTLYAFWPPQRSYNFERQGEILSQQQLTNAKEGAKKYLSSAIKILSNLSKGESGGPS